MRPARDGTLNGGKFTHASSLTPLAVPLLLGPVSMPDAVPRGAVLACRVNGRFPYTGDARGHAGPKAPESAQPWRRPGESMSRGLIVARLGRTDGCTDPGERRPEAEELPAQHHRLGCQCSR